MIVICDKAQDIVIPAGLGDNAGVVYEKSGVESLNGQQGDLTLKTVNGNELLGEGDVAIDTGVESLNGQKGALTLKTVNGNELTGEGNIEIQAGVESVNGQTGALKLKTIDNKDVLGEGNMDILSDYSICMFMMYNLTLSEADKGVDLYKYGIGDDAANLDKYFSGFKTIQFLNFNIKDGASYKVPVTVFWDGDGNRQFRFVCEGYEYTYTSIDANYCDFTSKVKIGGESGLKYKQITNESRQEVYDDVKAHWDNASGYTGDYVYFYQNGVDQIIFDEVKFENNTAYFNSASVGYTSGQVHNPLVRLLCCIVPSEGNIQINENGRVLSDVNGMRYEAEDAIVNSNSITFQENGYGDGYDVYNTTDTGTKDGLFDVRFRNGLDGFKGNAPASIFTDGTDVFMAFDVVDNHYVYKRDGNAWAFVSKTKIGGESGGDQNVIVLDGLTQEEVKAIYDKLDKSKVPDGVFVYLNSYSFRTYWDGEENLNFDIFRASYDAIELNKITVTKTGEIYRGREIYNYTNSCVIQVDSHVNETDPFECSYIGSFINYLQTTYNKPYAYFIMFNNGIGDSTKPVYAPFTVIWDKNNFDGTSPITIQFTIDGITYKYRNDLTNQNTWQYDGKISIYDSHSINGFNGTSLVLGDAALDATDKNKYIDMRAMMGHDTIFNGDNDGSCPYLTIITTDNQMYKVPVWVKCNKQNDSTTRATFEFDLNGYHYLYTQDNQGDLTYSFTSKTPIGGGASGDVPTKVSQLENDSKYINQSSQSSTYNIEHMWVGNQSQYDALETKDARTLFIII